MGHAGKLTEQGLNYKYHKAIYKRAAERGSFLISEGGSHSVSVYVSSVHLPRLHGDFACTELSLFAIESSPLKEIELKNDTHPQTQ